MFQSVDIFDFYKFLRVCARENQKTWSHGSPSSFLKPLPNENFC